MKVNTDGVLLGAAFTVDSSAKRILDIGTGTGTIALMAAQRLEDAALPQAADFMIDAIDIDEVSAEEAALNFSNSPWSKALSAHHASLEGFASSLEEAAEFDIIVSNPPYFESSLPAPEERRCAARHTAGLSYRDILDFASERLSESGKVSLVLPSEQEYDLTRHARLCGLFLFRVMRIRTVPRKTPSRIIAEFSRFRCEAPREEDLIIQDKGKYTQEYLSLTGDFYLFA